MHMMDHRVRLDVARTVPVSVATIEANCDEAVAAGFEEEEKDAMVWYCVQGDEKRTGQIMRDEP